MTTSTTKSGCGAILFYCFLGLCFWLSLFLCGGCKPLEQKCIERFPPTVTERVVEKTFTDSLYITEREVSYIDTTECLPAKVPYIVVKTVTKTLPGETVFYEYTCTDTIIEYRDAAKVQYLTTELAKNQTLLSESRALNRKRLYWIAAIMAAVGILVILVVYRYAANK